MLIAYSPVLPSCGWPGDAEFSAAARSVLGESLLPVREVEPTDAAGMRRLADRYRTGLGLTQDLYQAATWYRRAANLGDRDAQYSLARMLEQGLGVGEHLSEARRWYKLAAQYGDVHAQHHLAEMLRDGRGGPQDLEESAKWFLASGHRGHAEVFPELVRIFALGIGVSSSPVEAHAWHLLAIEAGLTASAFGRDNAQSLTDFERALADRRASAIRSTPGFSPQ